MFGQERKNETRDFVVLPSKAKWPRVVRRSSDAVSRNNHALIVYRSNSESVGAYKLSEGTQLNFPQAKCDYPTKGAALFAIRCETTALVNLRSFVRSTNALRKS